VSFPLSFLILQKSLPLVLSVEHSFNVSVLNPIFQANKKRPGFSQLLLDYSYMIAY